MKHINAFVYKILLSHLWSRFAVILLFIIPSLSSFSQTYTLDGKLEVTEGTTVGGDFRLSGAPISLDLGHRLLFLDDSGNVATASDEFLEALQQILRATPILTTPECDGPIIPNPSPFWYADTGRVFVQGAGCFSTPRVGIGLDEPEALLDVAYNARVGGADLDPDAALTVGSTSSPRGISIRQGVSGQVGPRVGLEVNLMSNNSNNVGSRVNLNSTEGILFEGNSGGERVFFVNGEGQLWSTEVHVLLAEDFPDYVFYPDYELMPLEELAAFIQLHGHLPGLPPANEVAANGINLGELTASLVQKIEELTLYTIDLNSQIQTLSEALSASGNSE